MKYLIRCRTEGGAIVPYPLEEITFVLDSLHDDDHPDAELAEDVLVALGSVPHGIFALFGGRLPAEGTAPLLYDCVVRLPEEVPADLVVRDGQVVHARVSGGQLADTGR
jgi:hypothetical protein